MSTPTQKVVQPTKEQTRIYMERRRHSRLPPSSIEEIRRQLGWYLTSK